MADPRTAEPLKWTYRCLVCEEYVHLKRGRTRVAHFAHYAKRDVVCRPETVLHEAAKRHLAQLLRDGLEAFDLHVPCIGYVGVYKRPLFCPDDGVVACQLPVPAFEEAGVEVPFDRYYLDAAAMRAGRVVLGLEVYQTHEVDEAKRAHLMASGVPWFEAEAGVVVESAMPWRVIRSSFGARQCEACREREAAATRERLEWEASLRRAAAERARQKKREELEERTTPVAWNGKEVVTSKGRRVGDSFPCIVCNRPVTLTRADGRTVFLHQEGDSCDPRRAWVRAGMLTIYRQLKRDPREIRIVRRCSGPGGFDECKQAPLRRPASLFR